jgi:xanthine dehydrogenase accessory factor
MKELLEILREAGRCCGEPLALATLVQSRGSSYRQCGARLLLAADGSWIGSLSGGCLEAEVAQRAQDVLRTGRPALMTFDTRARFGCHGAIDVFIERAVPALFDGVAVALAERRSCILATCFASMPKMGTRLAEEDEDFPASTFVQRLEPPVRLVIIGHGPDSRALEALARVLGWEVEFAESAADFRETYDARTAAVIGTHQYGRDFAALRALAGSPMAYLGLVGSRRRRDQLLCDLLDIGVEPGENLFAPAGLDLGAEAPEQIALAIVAEIQATLAAGGGGNLRTRKAPIHARLTSAISTAELVPAN